MFKDPEICRIMFDKSDVHTFSRLEVAMLVATFFRRVAKSGNPWKKKHKIKSWRFCQKSDDLYLPFPERNKDDNIQKTSQNLPLQNSSEVQFLSQKGDS